MVDRLAAIGAAVHDHTISVDQPFFLCQLANHLPEVTHQWAVGIGQCIKRRNFFFGNHEDMAGCLGCHIAKRQALLVLVKDVCMNFFVNDTFEDRFFSHGIVVV